MQDIDTRLKGLRRPAMLVTAARHAAQMRQSRTETSPAAGSVRHLVTLMEIEADMDANRRAGAAEYSAAGHVAALGAVLAAVAQRAADRDRTA